MGFNEKVHAYIAAKFYVKLTEAFGERGRKAFVHGTQYYAEQRGRRMAQRAIQDGVENLDYATYLQYGEWVNTEDIKNLNITNQSEDISEKPHCIRKITRCPWHQQFLQMGLKEAGHEYCCHLDNSICRGFNPYLTYKVPQSLHKSDYCIHIIEDSYIEPGVVYQKKPEYLKGFDYHCAHSYWSYTEVTEAVFGAAGRAVSTAVLQDLATDYGQDMADVLMGYQHTNFNVCQ